MANNKKHLTKRMIIMIIALIVVFGGIFGYGLVRSFFIKRYFATFTPPPATISTAKAELVFWRPSFSAVGSVAAINGVQVSPEVPGMIMKIYFQSGQMVKAGDPIIQLDDADDKQDLNNLLAQLKLAEITFRRQSILYKNQAAAASALDQAQASLQQLQAQVAKTQVIIEKKKVVAPFAGKLGIRQINLGQFVNAGTAIVSLQSMDPLYVNFSLPQQYLKDLYLGQEVQLHIDAYPNTVFPGKITAINAEVNNDTRNILVQATVPNTSLKLYPGMFADVDVFERTQQQVVVVPQTAVSFNLYGDSIFIIKPEGKDKDGKSILKAFPQYVVTGARRGNNIIITRGIKAGDEVVTSGQLKLNNGTQVIINNSVDIKQGNPNKP